MRNIMPSGESAIVNESITYLKSILGNIVNGERGIYITHLS